MTDEREAAANDEEPPVPDEEPQAEAAAPADGPACRSCGEPVDPQQLVCLNCGARVALKEHRSWATEPLAPIAALLVVVIVIGAGLFGFAISELTSDDGGGDEVAQQPAAAQQDEPRAEAPGAEGPAVVSGERSRSTEASTETAPPEEATEPERDPRLAGRPERPHGGARHDERRSRRAHRGARGAPRRTRGGPDQVGSVQPRQRPLDRLHRAASTPARAPSARPRASRIATRAPTRSWFREPSSGRAPRRPPRRAGAAAATAGGGSSPGEPAHRLRDRLGERAQVVAALEHGADRRAELARRARAPGAPARRTTRSRARRPPSGSSRCASKPAETRIRSGPYWRAAGATTCSTSERKAASPVPAGTARLNE